MAGIVRERMAISYHPLANATMQLASDKVRSLAGMPSAWRREATEAPISASKEPETARTSSVPVQTTGPGVAVAAGVGEDEGAAEGVVDAPEVGVGIVPSKEEP